jgi:Skp family chaperone for outer membrane proteins
MKLRHLTAAALAVSAFVAAPATAQVSGIAVAEPAIALARAQALQTAYQQIATTYEAQRTQLEQLQQQRQGLIRQFDTDNDGNLSEAEQQAAQANTTAMQQIQQLDQTIQQTQAPITLARAYVVEQLAQQLDPAFQQVISRNNIQLILNPSAALFIADPVDITGQVATELNRLAPTVSAAPPQGWQPQQASFNLYQEVQEVLLAAAIQQAQSQQAAPQQQPAQGQPVQGR